MSVVITCAGKTKEYFLNPIGSVHSGVGTNSSGLYLSDGKIVDSDGNDVTAALDTVLAESTVVGDMIVEYEE